MNEKFIQNLDKLPSDVRRQFVLLANQYGEKKKQTSIQKDFLTFVKHFHPPDYQSVVFYLATKCH